MLRRKRRDYLRGGTIHLHMFIVAADWRAGGRAGGFASFGEPARLIRNRSGNVTEVWLAASRLRRERAMAAEMRKRYGKS